MRERWSETPVALAAHAAGADKGFRAGRLAIDAEIFRSRSDQLT